MYGKTVNFHGVYVFCFGLPEYTEKKWQAEAKKILQLMVNKKEGK